MAGTEQQAAFVEALGAQLAASFRGQLPNAGKQQRAAFVGIARQAIQGLPTAHPVRQSLLDDFEAVAEALWTFCTEKQQEEEAPAAAAPCRLAAGGVQQWLASSGIVSEATLEALVRLPGGTLENSEQAAAAGALQEAVAAGALQVADALRLADTASCGEGDRPSPLALAAVAAALQALAESKKRAQPRQVAAARSAFHRAAKRPLVGRSAPGNLALKRAACTCYLQLCASHGCPSAERRPDEPAARCVARHIGLMLGHGLPGETRTNLPSSSIVLPPSV